MSATLNDVNALIAKLSDVAPASLLAVSRSADGAGAARAKAAGLFTVALPAHYPAQGDLMTWCQHMGPGLAALLILLGVVYLLYGFNLFKALVVLNAVAVGLVVGAAVGELVGAKIPVAIVGAVLLGAVTWPMMKYAVAIMGGSFGAMVGLTVWRMVDLDPAYAWSGALIGLVGGGLLCFILFRGCVMMYTSLQGAVMLILGLLGLLLKYQDVAPKVGTYLGSKPFLLPMCVFIPTVIGMMYQQAYGTGVKPAGGAAKK